MQHLLALGKNAQEIYEALAMTDVRMVADMLRPTYDQTGGQDGFVSIEVSPYLADDTEGTLAEVRRFWHTIERPNLMVKIPSTPAGVPAIRQALSEGININITLIFSIENYHQVAEAYLGALEERLAVGKDISRIASVASFFVSRVDALVDKLLEDKIKATTKSAEQQQLAPSPSPMPAWPIRSSNACSAGRALLLSSSGGRVSNGHCGPAQARKIRPTGMYCTSRN